MRENISSAEIMQIIDLLKLQIGGAYIRNGEDIVLETSNNATWTMRSRTAKLNANVTDFMIIPASEIHMPFNGVVDSFFHVTDRRVLRQESIFFWWENYIRDAWKKSRVEMRRYALALFRQEELEEEQEQERENI